VRRRSVFELADRATTAGTFAAGGETRGGALRSARAIHGLTDREREWLEFAAILHDIAYTSATKGTINTPTTDHQRRSARLRAGGGEAIALVARYPRQGTPKRRHAGTAICDVAGAHSFVRSRRSAARREPRSQSLADDRRPRAPRSQRPTISSGSVRPATPETGTVGGAAARRAVRTDHGQTATYRSRPRGRESTTDTYAEQSHASARVPGQNSSSSRGSTDSGKTTQLALLAKWLSAEGHRVFVTEWNSSALVKAATKTARKRNALHGR